MQFILWTRLWCLSCTWSFYGPEKMDLYLQTFQWERSNESAPQRHAALMPSILSVAGNSCLLWPDVGCADLLSLLSAAAPHPRPSFNLGQNRTLMAVSPFCWVSLNFTCAVSLALGMKVSPSQKRDLTIFLRGGDHHFHGAHSGLHSLCRCPHLVYMLMDKGEI